MSTKDFYKVLGVSKTVSQSDLKKAYHKLAMQYHPDRNSHDSEAEKKFKEINAAYDILKDEQKRAAYDRMGHDAFHNTNAGYSSQNARTSGFGPDINDIFGDFFSDFMGGSGNRRNKTTNSSTRGADLKYDISISLYEAFTGVDKNINFTSNIKCNSCNATGAQDGAGLTICSSCAGQGVTRIQQGFFTLEQTCSKCQGLGQIMRDPCKRCHGHGRLSQNRTLLVNIPSGIEEGTRIRLTGEGEAGFRGGNSGDLYIFVNIKTHDFFHPKGINLHCQISVNFITAILGGEVTIPDISGGKMILKIPPGTQNAEELKLRNKGMPKVRSTSKGDLLVRINILIPKTLTIKQRNLLQELEKEFLIKDSDNTILNKMKNIWS